MYDLKQKGPSSLRSEPHPLTSNSLFTGGERKDKDFYSLEATEEQLLLLGGVMKMGVLLPGLTPPIHYKAQGRCSFIKSGSRILTGKINTSNYRSCILSL